jgi:hypothetical protein
VVVGLAGRPREGGAEVVGGRVEPGPPGPGRGPPIPRQLGRAGQAPAQVPGPGGVEVAGVGEPFQAVLADGLHHPVAGAAGGRGDRQQALLSEPGQPVGDRTRLQTLAAGEGSGLLQGPLHRRGQAAAPAEQQVRDGREDGGCRRPGRRRSRPSTAAVPTTVATRVGPGSGGRWRHRCAGSGYGCAGQPPAAARRRSGPGPGRPSAAPLLWSRGWIRDTRGALVVSATPAVGNAVC